MNDVENLDPIKKLILSKTSLEQLLKDHVELKSQGGRLTGCCPFHSEKSPSFYVFPDHYHCFGCGAHGDAITFVRLQHGLNFLQALKWLAERFHVDVSFEEENALLKTWKKAGDNQKIMQKAQNFFRENLRKQGAQAIEILEKRGFTQKHRDLFEFGFAPEGSKALTTYLRQEGHELERLVELSLISMGKNGAYDFFRHRIMLPIKDQGGKIIAFAGRILEESGAQKYINSRYDKRKILYGLYEAKESIQKKGRAIVVEGYMDTLKMHIHGFPEAVACQGTALTSQHIDSLKGFTKRIYLLFDGDKAGQAANLKMITEAMKHPGLSFYVGVLKEGHDPDSFLSQHGAGALETVLSQAVDLLDFAIDQTLLGQSSTSIPQTLTDTIIPWLQTVSDPLQLNFLCQKIAQKTQISAEVLALQITPKRNRKKLQTVSEPQERLHPIVFDTLGHLYYSHPDRVDTKEIRALITRLDLPPLWDTWALEMTIYLENKEFPAHKSDGDWLGTHYDPVARFLEQLKSRRKAFEFPTQRNVFQMLAMIHEKGLIKETLASLRKQVAIHPISMEAPIEERENLIKDMASLSSRLNAIDKQFGS